MFVDPRMTRRNPPNGRGFQQATNRSEWTAMELPMFQLDANGGGYCFY